METLLVHATTVAIDNRAVMLMGRSGSGKSGLALSLIALGAVLVADDQTIVTLEGARLVASCPPPLRGRIEARGLGLLNAPVIERADIVLCADLDQQEEDRLPPNRHVTFLRHQVDLVYRVENSHFPAALLHYIRYGRHA